MATSKQPRVAIVMGSASDWPTMKHASEMLERFGAGGAAHLPGMIAAWTTLPVLGVPVESRVLRGVDSLLSIVQMPAGVPVATLAIGEAGARNAALLAIRMLSPRDPELRKALEDFAADQAAAALASELK